VRQGPRARHKPPNAGWARCADARALGFYRRRHKYWGVNPRRQALGTEPAQQACWDLTRGWVTDLDHASKQGGIESWACSWRLSMVTIECLIQPCHRSIFCVCIICWILGSDSRPHSLLTINLDVCAHCISNLLIQNALMLMLA